MNEKPRPYGDITPFPKDSLAQTLAAWRNAVDPFDGKIVVLDDDPTGVQTVHSTTVYTDASVESFREGFASGDRMFFILTNSRALSAADTKRLHTDIARALALASRESGKRFLLVSRSDSTLRGHYPLETDTLREVLTQETGEDFDGEIFCPYFREGGRYTLNGVHYVRAGDTLLPAGETEFAADPTFGYTSSDLREYIEEKSRGEVSAADVTSVSRDMGAEGIYQALVGASGYRRILVNAVCDEDLALFCCALYRAIAAGKRFLFRTAASFVRLLSGMDAREPLTFRELPCREEPNGGLVLVGSYTKKTTEQLGELLKTEGVAWTELNSALVDEPERMRAEIDRAARFCDESIASGKLCVVYTGRDPLSRPNDTAEAALARSVSISRALCSVMEGIRARPAFVLAKGGITSSDIGVYALRIRRARVLGQLIPGVPVWLADAQSRFPGLTYIIFPGNVGDRDSLVRAVGIVRTKESVVK